MDLAAPLTDWLTSAGLSLIHLEIYEEPGGFEMDYSGGSLAGVGEIVVDRAEESADPAEPGLALAAAAYVGEVLLRLAGGGWEWSGQAPAIRADPALDLTPQYPVELVARAVGLGDDDVFTQAYGQWEQAVTRYRTEHPQWTPVKQHTPGIDPDRQRLRTQPILRPGSPGGSRRSPPGPNRMRRTGRGTSPRTRWTPWSGYCCDGRRRSRT